MAQLIPVAISIGLNLIASLFAPKPDPLDLRVPRSDYGSPLPKIYGRARIEGNKFWPDTKERMYRQTTSSGKGGGGKRQQGPSVFGTFSVLFGQGPLDLDYLIINGENYGTDHPLYTKHATWFDGTQTAPWSEMVARDVPPFSEIAYTGIAYVGFNELPLRDKFGNQIPQQISAVVVDKELGENPPLSEVVKDICLRGGIANDQVDVTDIDDIFLLNGFIMPENGEGYRRTLEELFNIYLFTATERKDGIIAFKKLTTVTPEKTVEFDDYCPSSGNNIDNKSFIRSTTTKSALPNAITFKFNNLNKNYDSDEIKEYFEEFTKENGVTLAPSLTTTPEEARFRARRILRHSYLQTRNEYQFKIPSTYFPVIDLLDHISLPNGEKVQIEQMAFGADFLIDIKGKKYIGNNPLPEPPQDVNPPNLNPVPESVPFYLCDTPLVVPSDLPGTLYCFAYSRTNIFTTQFNFPLAVHENASIIANCLNIIGFPSLVFPSGIDTTNFLDVEMENGEGFSSITDDEFNAGLNLGLIARQNGNVWEGEFIQFRDVELLSPNRYRLTYLKRALFNTQRYLQNHPPNCKFFLFTGEDAYYSKIVTNGFQVNVLGVSSLSSPFQDIATAPTVNVSPLNNSYIPPAPSSVTATVDPDDNLTYNWQYNPPFNTNNTTQENPTFEIEFLDDMDNVVRNETTRTPTFRYPQQIRQNDGLMDTTLKVRIFAVSSVAGRGDPLEEIVVPVAGDYRLDDFRIKVNNQEQPPRPIINFTDGNSIRLTTDVDQEKSTVGFNIQTISKSITTNYTLLLEDEFKWLKCSGDITITAPPNINPIYSFECIIQNVGTGTITIDGIPNAAGTKITEQWRAAHLYFDTIEWTAVGYLEP